MVVMVTNQQFSSELGIVSTSLFFAFLFFSASDKAEFRISFQISKWQVISCITHIYTVELIIINISRSFCDEKTTIMKIWRGALQKHNNMLTHHIVPQETILFIFYSFFSLQNLGT